MQVGDGYDHNNPGWLVVSKQDSIRKAFYQRPPHIAVYSRIRLGIQADSPDRRIHFLDELVTQPWMLHLIPFECLVKLCLRGFDVADVH